MKDKTTTLIIAGILVLAVAVTTTQCAVNDTNIMDSPGDVNVTVTAGQDVDWNQNYYELNFGSINRCESVNTTNETQYPHALEVINRGLTPVNVKIKYSTALFTHPSSEWNYMVECKAINPDSGNTYGFAGDCWDGTTGIQDTFTAITDIDTNVITCLNYRSEGAGTKPGVRIDNELVVACEEEEGEKNGVVGLTFETADIAVDCGGDSGFDPGG